MAAWVHFFGIRNLYLIFLPTKDLEISYTEQYFNFDLQLSLLIVLLSIFSLKKEKWDVQ